MMACDRLLVYCGRFGVSVGWRWLVGGGWEGGGDTHDRRYVDVSCRRGMHWNNNGRVL